MILQMGVKMYVLVCCSKWQPMEATTRKNENQ